MKRRALIVAIIALCAGITVPQAGAAGGSRLTAVALTVEVDGDPSTSLSPNNIRSDGNGVYVNGTDGFTASFESDGNFVIRGMGTRSLYFEYDAPLIGIFAGDSSLNADPEPAVAPPGLDAAGGLVPPGCTVATLRTGSIALQNMAIGSQQCLRMVFTFNASTGGTIYRNTFQRTKNGALPAAVDGTAWGIITRVDANTWTIVSSNACGGEVVLDRNLDPQASGASRLIKAQTVKGKTTTTNEGLFDLPFSMTLRRQ